MRRTARSKRPPGGLLKLITGLLEPTEGEPERLSGLQDRANDELTPVGVGAERLGELLRERDEALLELPYGRAWEELKRQRRLELGQA